MDGGTVYEIKIESDERGFELHLETDTGPWVFNIHAVAAQLFDAARVEIRPWLREKAHAYAEYLAAEGFDDADGYEISDPKHPRYHSTHADLWDAREGK